MRRRSRRYDRGLDKGKMDEREGTKDIEEKGKEGRRKDQRRKEEGTSRRVR